MLIAVAPKSVSIQFYFRNSNLNPIFPHTAAWQLHPARVWARVSARKKWTQDFAMRAACTGPVGLRCLMSHNSSRRAAFDTVNRQQHFNATLRGLSAHERHLRFINDYARFYGGASTAPPDPGAKVQGTDLSALQAGHRFIRTSQDDADSSWEAKLARRYYKRLFKEYCIADLSRYKESQLGLRWRTEQEVVTGKGQFTCGAKRCEEKVGLCSYEVNFSYLEAGEKKQALVKLRICPSCACKLNYKREVEYRKAAAAAAPSRAKRSAGEQLEGSNKRANLAAAAQLLSRCLEQGGGGGGGSTGSIAPPPHAPQQQGAEHYPAAAAAAVLPGDDSLWERQPAQEAAVTAEEDFEQYFDGLFV